MKRALHGFSHIVEQTIDYWMAFVQVCIEGIIEARER